jgi:hypothetical protein
MYLYLSSQQSTDVYPTNKPTAFTVDIKTPIFLDNPQDYEIALVEAEVPFFKNAGGIDATNFFILCDIVDSSIVNGFNAPILRRIPIPSNASTGTITAGTIESTTPPSTSTVQITTELQATNNSTFYLFDVPLYLTCLKSYIENIRVEVKSLNLEDLENTTDPIFLTLHLRKKEKKTDYLQY